MKWIYLKEAKLDSPLYIMTTHVSTALKNRGALAVRSWTLKESIDIFEKRLILLPINENNHWSLRVVINPGSCCDHGGAFRITHLDSLGMHDSRKNYGVVMGRLESEYERIFLTVHHPERKIIMILFCYLQSH